MQYRPARKVTAQPQQAHTWRDLQHLAIPMADRWIGTHDPLGIGNVQVDGATKGARPILHARIVMRVRDRDGGKPAQGANQRFGRIVQQRNAVPQDITLRGSHQERALADTEAGMGMDLEQVALQPPPGVDVLLCKPGWCCPNLSAARHELPFILTNRAAGGRLTRIRIRRSASGAYMDRHHRILDRWRWSPIRRAHAGGISPRRLAMTSRSQCREPL